MAHTDYEEAVRMAQMWCERALKMEQKNKQLRIEAICLQESVKKWEALHAGTADLCTKAQAECDKHRAEVERLRSAMLSEQQITRILRCLNTPYQADLRLVLLDLYAAQDAVSTQKEGQE